MGKRQKKRQRDEEREKESEREIEKETKKRKENGNIGNKIKYLYCFSITKI